MAAASAFPALEVLAPGKEPGAGGVAVQGDVREVASPQFGGGGQGAAAPPGPRRDPQTHWGHVQTRAQLDFVLVVCMCLMVGGRSITSRLEGLLRHFLEVESDLEA